MRLKKLSLIPAITFFLIGCQSPVKENSPSAVESLTRIVNQTVSETQAVSPSGDNTERRTTYSELKTELENVEYEIDTYEEYLEKQYTGGTLSFEEYQIQERELEKLNEQIDDAEDKLAITFGVDD